jgi:hypothetical protein
MYAILISLLFGRELIYASSCVIPICTADESMGGDERIIYNQ